MVRHHLRPSASPTVPQNTSDSTNLLRITFNRTGKLLVVELGEPHGLSIIRSLARGLEVQPLLCEVGLVGSGREAQFVLLIVLLDQILDNCTGFPQGEVRVGIVYGGHAAIGI